MGRYSGADCRLCRRSGEKLFLKGTRCSTAKCAIEKRNFPPGMHKQGHRGLSDYAVRQKEKQKVKRIYGLMERQFRRYFRLAERKKGVTGLNLLRLLEMRLDNVVYQSGLALSRDQARQITKHGHICVNGKKVDIPSFEVRVNDVVEVSPLAREYKIFKDNIELSIERPVPGWLESDRANLKLKVLRLPAREDIAQDIQENLIVEMYSR